MSASGLPTVGSALSKTEGRLKDRLEAYERVKQLSKDYLKVNDKAKEPASGCTNVKS